jgi:hypothetical protein
MDGRWAEDRRRGREERFGLGRAGSPTVVERERAVLWREATGGGWWRRWGVVVGMKKEAVWWEEEEEV